MAILDKQDLSSFLYARWQNGGGLAQTVRAARVVLGEKIDREVVRAAFVHFSHGECPRLELRRGCAAKATGGSCSPDPAMIEVING